MSTIQFISGLLCTTLCLTSCNQMRVASARDPLANTTPIRSVVILPKFERLDLQTRIEDIGIEQFKDESIAAVPGSKYLPTFRSYTQEERNTILTRNHIDGLLVIDIPNVDYTINNHPEKVQREKVRKIDSTYNSKTKKTTYDTSYNDVVTHTEAYTSVDFTNVTISASLYTPGSTNPVWKAEVNTPCSYTTRLEQFEQATVKTIPRYISTNTWADVFEAIAVQSQKDNVIRK